MAGIGPNGSITTHPGCGEKICAGCEHWRGAREATYNGTAATTYDSGSAMCDMKRREVYPNQPCTCMPSRFEKWHMLR